jgi:hypothetical protein
MTHALIGFKCFVFSGLCVSKVVKRRQQTALPGKTGVSGGVRIPV